MGYFLIDAYTYAQKTNRRTAERTLVFWHILRSRKLNSSRIFFYALCECISSARIFRRVSRFSSTHRLLRSIAAVVVHRILSSRAAFSLVVAFSRAAFAIFSVFFNYRPQLGKNFCPPQGRTQFVGKTKKKKREKEKRSMWSRERNAIL